MDLQTNSTTKCYLVELKSLEVECIRQKQVANSRKIKKKSKNKFKILERLNLENQAKERGIRLQERSAHQSQVNRPKLESRGGEIQESRKNIKEGSIKVKKKFLKRANLNNVNQNPLLKDNKTKLLLKYKKLCNLPNPLPLFIQFQIHRLNYPKKHTLNYYNQGNHQKNPQKNIKLIQ